MIRETLLIMDFVMQTVFVMIRHNPRVLVTDRKVMPHTLRTPAIEQISSCTKSHFAIDFDNNFP